VNRKASEIKSKTNNTENDMQKKDDFNTELKQLINRFVHKAYDITDAFPKSEVFGLTSQLKRASMSVALNYIEGYARKRRLVFKNSLETSYGSLKESAYIIEFAYNRHYISKEVCSETLSLTDRIGAMLWGIISKLSD